jgi:DNA-binding transcriptional regulator GbsR (MarR family)
VNKEDRVSDELLPEDETLDFESETDEAEYEAELDEYASDADEYEEISSEEVDRVVAALEDLLENVESENVRMHLEEAMNNVYYLVYDEADEELGEAA